MRGVRRQHSKERRRHTFASKMKTKIVPVITPFENYKVNSECLRNHVAQLLEDGVDYVFLCGSTGLGPSLGFEERTQVLGAVKDIADRIILQVGSLNMAESLKLAELAKSMRVHAISAYPPYYFPRIPDDWVIKYYVQLSNVYPLLIYNFPLATGYDVSPQVVKKVIDGGGGDVIGVKDTVNDVAHMLSFKYALGEDFKVYSGPDNAILPAARSGLDGSVAGSGNYATELFVKLLKEPQSEEANDIQRFIVELALLSRSHGQWSANYALTRLIRGYEVGDPRPPVFPLSTEDIAKLKTELYGIMNSEKNRRIARYLIRFGSH